MAILGLTYKVPGRNRAILPKYRHSVHIRQNWDDDWEFVPYLTALSATQAILPGRSRAEFVYRFGDMKREDTTSFFQWLSLAQRIAGGVYDAYIAIRAWPEGDPAYTLWSGIVPAQSFDIFATQTTLSPQLAGIAGDQRLVAYGWDHVLERRSVPGAWVYGDGTGDHIDGAPPFNDRLFRGATQIGNRSEFKIDYTPPAGSAGEVSFGFENDVDSDGNPFAWSVRDVIEYLLFWSGQRPLLDHAASSEPNFVIGGPTTALGDASHDVIGYLDRMQNTTRQEGRNVWSILKELLPRMRGIGAMFVPKANTVPTIGSGVTLTGNPNHLLPEGDIELQVFSESDTPSVVGTFKFPSNPSSEIIVLDKDIDVEKAIISIDSLQTYDQVIVQGSQTVSCFSARPNQVQLVEIVTAWATADRTAYEQLTSVDGGKTADQQRRDPRWGRVFRTFRLPDDFAWNPGVGSVNPTFDRDGNVALTQVGAFLNPPDLLSWLPIQSDGETTAESKEPRLLAPIVIVEKFDEDGNATGIWQQVETPEDAGELKGGRVTIHDRDGLIEVSYQEAPHILGRNHFNPAEPPDFEPVFDYNNMIATIAVRTDTRPTVEVLTGAPGGKELRVLTIPVPEVEVWVVAPGTVIGVNPDGSPKLYAGTRVVRDDSDRLRSVAALAKAVYSKRRASVRVTRKGLLDIHPLGRMIAGVTVAQQSTPVNAVVMQRTWDFVAETTTVQTGILNLDVRGVR